MKAGTHNSSPNGKVTLVFKVTGMTCESCEKSIEYCLEKVAGLKSVRASASENKVVVLGSKEMSLDVIIEKITEMGYKANQIESEAESLTEDDNIYFSIAGMSSQAEADKIKAFLYQHEPSIISCENEFATQRAIIKANINPSPEKLTSLIETMRVLIESTPGLENEIKAKPHKFLSKPKGENVLDKFKRSAKINGIAIAITLFVSNYVPMNSMPLKLGMSLFTFIVMWYTGKEYFQKAFVTLKNNLPEVRKSFTQSAENLAQLRINYQEFKKQRQDQAKTKNQQQKKLQGFAKIYEVVVAYTRFYLESLKSVVSPLFSSWCDSFDMNSLIALGVGCTFISSFLALVTPRMWGFVELGYQMPMVHMILGALGAGSYLKERAQNQTKGVIQKLISVFTRLQPQLARVKINDKFEQVDYNLIKANEVIYLAPFERCPVDAVLIGEDSISVEQRHVTGQTCGATLKKGDQIFSGTMLNSCADAKCEYVMLRATCDGSKGELTRKIQHITSIPKSSKMSKLLDEIAKKFAPTIIILAIVMPILWYFFGPHPVLPGMINSAVALLVGACPCAVGLSYPMSKAISLYVGFDEGIFANRPEKLEEISQVNALIFDKNGTLTMLAYNSLHLSGELSPEEYNIWHEETVLRYVASLEKSPLISSHPIAKAFVIKGSVSNLKFFPCTDAQKHDLGVWGIVNNKEVAIGNLSYLQQHLRIEVSAELQKIEQQFASMGQTGYFIAIDKKCIGVAALEDIPCPGAKETIQALKKMGFRDIYMLTGSNTEIAIKTAAKLGIENVYAQQQDKQKKEIVAQLQKEHPTKRFAMIGDGLNDTNAMEQATVGIAINPSTDAAESADFVVERISDLPKLFIIANETNRNIQQNIKWLWIYNSVFAAVQSGFFYLLYANSFGMNAPLLRWLEPYPLLSSTLMLASSIGVTFNSTRLLCIIRNALAAYKGTRPSKPDYWQQKLELLGLRSVFDTMELFTGFNPDKKGSPQPARAHPPTAVQGASSPSPRDKRPVLYNYDRELSADSSDPSPLDKQSGMAPLAKASTRIGV